MNTSLSPQLFQKIISHFYTPCSPFQNVAVLIRVGRRPALGLTNLYYMDFYFLQPLDFMKDSYYNENDFLKVSEE